MTVNKEALVRIFAVMMLIKVTGFISISWWIVLAPVWVPVAYWVFCFITVVWAERKLK